MPMFVPFFVATCIIIAAFMQYRIVSYVLWGTLFIITLVMLIHHMTDSLNISL